jgi:hypothetical protein
MNQKVNIVALVDVMRALSQGTLDNGNLSLVDDGSFDSEGQGTPGLRTVVAPGQVVQWSALAVDVQTPVAIAGITFLGAAGPGGNGTAGNGTAQNGTNGNGAGASAQAPAAENPDLNVWSGIVPAWLIPGVPYQYRLRLKMHDGPHSVLQVDSPALISI